MYGVQSGACPVGATWSSACRADSAKRTQFCTVWQASAGYLGKFVSFRKQRYCVFSNLYLKYGFRILNTNFVFFNIFF